MGEPRKETPGKPTIEQRSLARTGRLFRTRLIDIKREAACYCSWLAPQGALEPTDLYHLRTVKLSNTLLRSVGSASFGNSIFFSSTLLSNTTRHVVALNLCETPVSQWSWSLLTSQSS